ncbi:MAG: hypothetical protein KJO32_04350 [Deltaproteobacteria bacterium]|nr:hypothetical protein [Deltaproteobacteria bacterium]
MICQEGLLEVRRLCRRIRMYCSTCDKEFFIHEIADQLDQETEEILERYNAIIYD